MNYIEVGEYSGELSAVFNNFGDISAWIDPNGYTKYAAIYDLNNGLRNELHNPLPGISVPYGFNARNGDITIQVGTGKDLIIDPGSSSFSITNPWGDIDVTDLTTTTTTTDTTEKGGGDGALAGSYWKVMTVGDHTFYVYVGLGIPCDEILKIKDLPSQDKKKLKDAGATDKEIANMTQAAIACCKSGNSGVTIYGGLWDTMKTGIIMDCICAGKDDPVMRWIVRGWW